MCKSMLPYHKYISIGVYVAQYLLIWMLSLFIDSKAQKVALVNNF